MPGSLAPPYPRRQRGCPLYAASLFPVVLDRALPPQFCPPSVQAAVVEYGRARHLSYVLPHEYAAHAASNVWRIWIHVRWLLGARRCQRIAFRTDLGET